MLQAAPPIFLALSKCQAIDAIVQGAASTGHWLQGRQIAVGSVQTVARRLGQIPAPDLIIQDETHHLVAGNVWGRIIHAWPEAHLIGKAATPERLDGKGLAGAAPGLRESGPPPSVAAPRRIRGSG
jgi:superfamily II DNA or RNA helicase